LANGIVASLSPSDAGLSTDVFWLALFTALCPSVFYNFVDFSFWQKYSSEVRNAEPATSMKKRVAKSFWIYVFESPLSWLLPVILGAYAISLEDATANLANPIPFIVVALSSEGWFGSICSVLFYASLVAIATSTACGYLVAMGYLYDADIKCSRSAPHSDGHDGISGDFFLVGLGAVLIVVLLPVDMLTETAEQLIVLMLTCFAPLCALTPLVVWPMVKGHVNLQPRGKAGVTAALGFGSAIGIVTGVAAWAMASETRSLLYWAPLPLSFFVSWSIYVFSVLFWKERAVAGGVVNGRGP
jgi:hypothetical protein